MNPAIPGCLGQERQGLPGVCRQILPIGAAMTDRLPHARLGGAAYRLTCCSGYFRNDI
jgi:hypothetical protein